MTVGITVDDALKLVGGYRRWHVVSFVLISFTSCMTLAWQNLSIIFIGWYFKRISSNKLSLII